MTTAAATQTTMPRAVPALWAFARPHTLIGTTLSVLALFALVPELRGTPRSFLLLTGALGACLAANLYIVGLNQLFDVEIDRINKPDLPLVSGALTVPQGTVAAGIAGFAAMLLAFLQGGWLLLTVGASAILGTLYSAPPARWKRYPALAALCIFVVRGPVVNLGLFLYFRTAFGGPARVTTEVWCLTSFMVALGAVIALFKDVPDVEGDRKFQIGTYAVRFGTEGVLRWTRATLFIAYGALTGAAFESMTRVTAAVLTVVHSGAIVWLVSQETPAAQWDRSRSRTFYRSIWRLFYLEYLMFPLACLIGRS